jgi:two-component system chemotaxis response regulator CheB
MSPEAAARPGAPGPGPASGAPGLDLVAVGCSWGGLAAASRLLESLPDCFEVATVIVQHRSEAPSALAELLARHTSRPVAEPNDKEPVVPGRVYVAPPGYHLLVDRNRFSLDTEAPVRYSRPSVDVLFESAAEAYGRRLAAVVLTGANDDGAKGLARVAAAGGLALVQDPATADRAAMPCAALAAVPSAVVGDIPTLARTLVAAAFPEGLAR